MAGAGLLGCDDRRKVCDRPLGPGESRELSAFWTEHQRLLPAGLKVCAVEERTSLHRQLLEGDFDPEPEGAPVGVIDQIQKLGWIRAQKKIDERTFQATFIDHDAILSVKGWTLEGRTKVSFTFFTQPTAEESERAGTGQPMFE